MPRAGRAPDACPWKWLLFSTVLFVAWALLAPCAASAEGGSLADIQQAIQDQCLDWTAKDYGRDYRTGLALSRPRPQPKGELLRADRTSGAGTLSLPTALDWRASGGNYVSPVKDQLDCGSCWAFAAVGVLESLIAIDNSTSGVFLDLSEQILVSCDVANYGCDGGDPEVAARFLQTEGTSYEACYPYIHANGACSAACGGWRTNAFRIVEYESVAATVEGLKRALQEGPFQVGLEIYGDFKSYSSGVYERAWGSDQGGHAVLLVGYRDVPGSYGGGYFIVKNSWGAAWGESGYFRIGYSQVTNTLVQFGMASYLYYLTAPAGDAYEPDGNAQQASALTAGISQEHSIRPAGDVDWTRFSLAGQTPVVLSTNGPSGYDTYLYVYDRDLQLVASDDDSGPGLYSYISTSLGPGAYYVRVNAYWSNDVIPYFTLLLEAAGGTVFTRTLQAGWNLVSVPLAPASTAIGDVLRSIAGAYEVVMTYDAVSRTWPWYDPVRPTEGPLQSLDEGTPVWIRMTAPAVLSVQGMEPASTAQLLSPGWNLIAFPSSTALDVNAALSSVGGHWVALWGHEDGTSPSQWRYHAYDSAPYAQTLSQCEPGHAYWLRVRDACTLTITNP